MWRTDDPSRETSNADFDEATAISLPTDAETTVLSRVGDANCCDVWVKVPNVGFGSTVRLYGVLADVRVLLAAVRLTQIDVTSDGSFLSAIPISVRGRPATAFEVTLQRPVGTAVVGAAVYLKAWQDLGGGGVDIRHANDSLYGPARAAATCAFNMGWDTSNDEWRRLQLDDAGALQAVLTGGSVPTDNLAVGGTAVNRVWAMSSHRNQAGNWYLSRGGYSGAVASTDIPALQNVIATGAHFSASPPTPANGGASALQVDGRGALYVVQGRATPSNRDAPSPYNSTAVSGSVKNAPGNLLGFELSNGHTSAIWLQLFNLTAAPGSGATPIWRALVPASQRYQLGADILTRAGLHFSTGIAWGISSARGTFTASTGSEFAVNATFV